MKSLLLTCLLTFACGVGSALLVGATPTRHSSRPVVLASPTPDESVTTRTVSTPETGVASYYAGAYHGKRTASGEIFDLHELTAAHRTLPFGTLVKVTRPDNEQSVLVRINDRGPFVAGRVIDLSLAAAQELEMVRSGLAPVELDVVH